MSIFSTSPRDQFGAITPRTGASGADFVSFSSFTGLPYLKREPKLHLLDFKHGAVDMDPAKKFRQLLAACSNFERPIGRVGDPKPFGPGPGAEGPIPYPPRSPRAPLPYGTFCRAPRPSAGYATEDEFGPIRFNHNDRDDRQRRKDKNSLTGPFKPPSRQGSAACARREAALVEHAPPHAYLPPADWGPRTFHRNVYSSPKARQTLSARARAVQLADERRCGVSSLQPSSPTRQQ